MKTKSGFLWGVATSAYQIEGAASKDGKSPSIWDVFAHHKGNIVNDENGDIAADHYHRFLTDLSWLKKLGVNSYRFSISWSRVFPSNNHQPNLLGLAFYDKIIDRLLSLNIEPIITLYHWDMPQYLEDMGGFLNRQVVDEFAFYASFIASHFKGRVKYYITINEPECVIEFGLRQGRHAPGKNLDVKDSLLAVHHLLLSHGAAIKAMREVDKSLQLGIALTSSVVIPINQQNHELYHEAKKKQFAIFKDDFFNLSLYGDPIFLKDYPQEYYELYKGKHPKISAADLDLISTPVDICYVNLYSGYYVNLLNNELITIPNSPKMKIGSLPWLKFTPEALYYGPRYLYERYAKPIIISENGVCICGNQDEDEFHDSDRQEFLASYLEQLQRARDEGIVVCGYFYWSLIDNFEWTEGYDKRFGLVYVDFSSQKRTAKRSFTFYKHYIKSHK